MSNGVKDTTKVVRNYLFSKFTMILIKSRHFPAEQPVNQRNSSGRGIVVLEEEIPCKCRIRHDVDDCNQNTSLPELCQKWQ